ncbi:MAG TPA: VWA domain-containing protein [Vicinamibacterales bacterium]|nr:VWA domain-containing protein [Vicinamibacterales bacterium]
MSPARAALVAAVLTSGLAASSLVAQTAQQPTFRSRTVLVPVFVVAVDERTGDPVMDLTVKDFTLRDRGRVQEISVFDAVRRPGEDAASPFTIPPDVPRDVASNRSESHDRLVVVLIDDLHMYNKRDERARTIARDLITQLAPGSMMAMVFTSGQTGVQVTDDHTELLRAADRIKGRKAQPRPTAAIDMQASGPRNPENIDSIRAAAARAQGASLQDFFDNMTFFRTLRDISKMLRADDGRRKVFVMVSEGMGKDLSWLEGRSSPRDGGIIDDPDQVVRMSYHDEAVLDMVREMRRANISTYAVDPRGYVSEEGLLRECRPSFIHDDPCSGSAGLTGWSSVVRFAQAGLSEETRLTGGFAVTNTDAFSQGISRIRSDLDNYYLLGFYPSNPDGKGFRELKIDVDREGVVLRFRQGYEIVPPEKPRADRGELTRLATGVLPTIDLPLRMFAAPFPGLTRDTTRVAVTIEVAEPLSAVVDDQGNVADNIRYTLFAANAKNGKVVQQLENTAKLSSLTPMGRDAPPVVLYQVPMTLTLPPGTYQIRASAISEKMSAGGSVYMSVEVPDFARAPVAISGIVVGSTEAPEIPNARPPKPTDLVPFTPALMREFVRGDTLRLIFQVARGGLRAANVTFSVVDAAGKTASSFKVPMPQGDRGVVDIKLPLKEYSPGVYRLRVTAEANGGKAEKEIGVVVR